MELRIDGISKTYKRGEVKALQQIDMVLTNGVYALLGPNGAGKSTLMNIITDNLSADVGCIYYDGKDVKRMGENYRNILGYMPQQQEAYSDFTGWEFLHYMSILKGMDRKKAKEKIKELLCLVNLENVASKKIGTYSGGMRQRILLAQALLNDPKILILDEPTAGLDPRERIRIRNFISEIAGDKIVLFATHVVSDIEYIAKEVLVLKKGKLIFKDTIENILGTMEDKVYEALVQKEEVSLLQKEFMVSNLVHEVNGIKVRLISDSFPNVKNIINVKPGLEDFYLYHFSEEMR